MPRNEKIPADTALAWLQIAVPAALALIAATVLPDLSPAGQVALAMTGICGSALVALSLCKLTRAIKLQQNLELRAHQQREDFLCVLLHNMKGPLIGATHTLEAMSAGVFGEIRPDVLRTLDIVKRSNQEMLRLSESLVGIYRLENQQREFCLDRVDLKRAVTRVQQEMEGRALAAGVKIVSEIPANLPCPRADSESLTEILSILVDNAIKHSQADSAVEIRAKEQDRRIIIEVCDHGQGISPQDVDSLFRTFWHGTKERPYAAKVGMSLYYAFRLVQANGGKMTCESAPGKGTIFKTALPVSGATIKLFPPVIEEPSAVTSQADARGS